MPRVLDEFMPAPDVRERFEITVAAPADLVYAVARDFDMQSIPLVRAIFELRARLTGATPVERRPQGLMAEMRSLGWGVLREDPGALVVAGASCQPWLADVRFHAIPPADFGGYAAPEQVKIAWTLEAETIAPARTRFASETRAVATDAAARRRFLRYWRWARFGIIPVRWLLLPAVRREAERRWRSRQLPA